MSKENLLLYMLRFTSFYFQLKLLSTAQWVDRHTVLTDILAMNPDIKADISCLSVHKRDTKTITEARSFRLCMGKREFIVAFVIYEHMLGYSKQLSITLQGKQLVGEVGFY